MSSQTPITDTRIKAGATIAGANSPANGSIDILAGTFNNDTLSGTAGNDSIFGLGGEDVLSGGLGNDFIDGGDGTDRASFNGNLADYTFNVVNGVIQVKDNNSGNGDEGTDTLTSIESLNFSNRLLSVADGLRYIASYGDLILAFGSNADAGLSHYLNHAQDENRAVTFDPAIYLSKYADLRLQFGNNLGAATFHYISSGFLAGRNLSLDGADNLGGSTGDDIMHGYAGNDTIKGSSGNDILYGEEGNDVLDGGDGNDVLQGGSGLDNYSGGAGRDELIFNGGTRGVRANLKTGVIANDGYGNTESVSGVEVLRTGALNDLLTLSDADGAAYSGDGADIVVGGVGRDILDGGAGDDSLSANDGNDYLFGGAGNDSLSGGNGNDVLDGGAGDDNLVAGAGNDVLMLSAGNDTMDGGDGIDTLDLGAADLSGMLNVSIDLINNNLAFTTSGGDSYITTITGVENIRGGDSAESFTGTSGDNTFTGNGGNDTIFGFEGIDIVQFSGNFDDYLVDTLGSDGYNILVEDQNLENGNDGGDLLLEVEVLRFSDGDVDISHANILRYIASYDDLIAEMGTQLNVGLISFLNNVPRGLREVSFDPVAYLNKYADVRALVGNDLQAATLYYINTGHALGHTLNFNSADNLAGTSGDDTLQGYGGNDTIDGGDGNDVVNYQDYVLDYRFTVNAGVITIKDIYTLSGDEGTDTVRNVETLHFGDRSMNLTNMNVLRYIASHGDLINAMGTNLDAGLAHYLNLSVKEGREISFDPQVYLNKYADVRLIVGTDPEAVTRHYISIGFGLGRNAAYNSADNLSGTAGDDTIQGYGGNDTINGGTGNDVVNYQGNLANYRFSVTNGVIAVTDKYLQDGDEGRDLLRNVETLHFADRDMNATTLNALRYVASHTDLMWAFGTNVDAGLAHYLNSSVSDGRAVNFDPLVYLNKYADVRATSGTDLEAATRHFISTGFAAGRSDSLTSNDNLVGTNGADTINGYGGNDTIRGGRGNDVIDGGDGTDIATYLDYAADYSFSVSNGVITITDRYLPDGNEGSDTLRNVEVLRFGDRDMNVTTLNVLRYIATYGDLVNAIGTNIDVGLRHYLSYSVKEGRAVGFDPNVYLAKYADVRTAYDTDLEAATRHFLTTGFGQGRNLSLSGNDLLGGGSAADTLNGGLGNDTLNGGAGNDTLTGGSGADVFKFGAGSGNDVITDFSQAQGDKIYIAGNVNGSGITTPELALSFTFGPGDAVVYLMGGHTITLTGVNVNTLTAADFVIY